MKDKLFFIDAETDGLNGPFITVAIVITDLQCNELRREYFGVKKENLTITNEWVKENVVPILGDYRELESENDLLEETWRIWCDYKEEAYAIGDVISPVEARLFQRCVANDLEKRAMEAPFPFLDISSMLYVKGYNPVESCENLLQEFGEDTIPEGTVHNALFDVEAMIKIYKKIAGS
ncbi:MAG: hypothetical protein ACI4S2_17900 [Lachnospiraceae bacterium]